VRQAPYLWYKAPLFQQPLAQAITANLMPTKASNLLKILFATTMVVGLGIWVHVSYGWIETLSRWNGVPVTFVIGGALFVVFSHIARVGRIHYAFNRLQPSPFRKILAVSLVHNTVSFLLPMRLGELALPALSRHQLNIDIKYSMATLLLIRLFDAHVLLCLLVFFAGNLWLDEYAVIAPIALVVSLPLGMHLLQAVGKRVGKIAFAMPLIENQRTWITLYCYSVVIWSVKLFALALLASTLGHLPIDHAWIATIIADASALSPITGFANAGTFELAFTLPLLPLGYASEPLVKTAVNVHLFIFIINICVGIAGFVLLESKRSPTSST